jgi:DNA-binding MarR family transcriptional regulator
VAEAFVRHGVLRIAAVEPVTGEASTLAEVLAPGVAVPALPAGPTEPGHPHPLARSKALSPGPETLDDSHDLVTGDQRELRIRQLAVDDVEVGAAHAAGTHPQEHLAGAGIGEREVALGERTPGLLEHHRAHGASLATATIVNVVNDLAVDAVTVANRLRPVLLQLNRGLRGETRSLGITGGQASLLWLIHRNPGIGVGELAEREGMSAPGMSGYIDRLEAAGLLTRTRSAEDRRRVGLRVTDAGKRVLRAVRSRRTAWLAARLGDLDPEELEAIDAAIVPLQLLLGDAA